MLFKCHQSCPTLASFSQDLSNLPGAVLGSKTWPGPSWNVPLPGAISVGGEADMKISNPSCAPEVGLMDAAMPGTQDW